MRELNREQAPKPVARPRPSQSGDEIRILNPTLASGFTQVPSPVLRARGLSQEAKCCYALLLDYAWQKGSCFPGQERLAWDLGVRRRQTASAALNELREYGLIDWSRRPNRSNVYLILDYTSDSRLALLRTEDGKPYLERVEDEAELDVEAKIETEAPTTNVRKNAHQAKSSESTEPATDVRKTAPATVRKNALPDRRKTAPEEYSPEANSIETDAAYKESGSLFNALQEANDGGSELIAPRKFAGLGLDALWKAAQNELRQSCGKAVYESGVASSRLVDLEGSDLLIIATSSSFARRQLESRVGADEISRAIASVVGVWPRVRFLDQS